MNERIDQLIEQCTTQQFSDCVGGYETFDKEKFAELVVGECRTVINDLYHKMPLQLAVVLIDADNEIMKHFYGVKK